MAALYAYAMNEEDPLAVFAGLHSLPYSLLFDSADRAHPQARYSFIAFHPFETIEAKDGQVTVTNRDQQLSFRGDPFAIVQQRLEEWGMDLPARADLPPFQGGAAGYFGYDLVHSLETLKHKKPAGAAPDMAIGLYDQVVAFDHQAQKSWFITLCDTESEARARLEHLKKLMQNASSSEPALFPTPDWRAAFDRESYKAAVQKVIDYIYAGDIFQANLSQPFEAALPPAFDSFAHYRHLRRVNPAPFASYMNMGGVRLASASPERFLSVRGRQVETRPIKGTRRRHADPAEDERLKISLSASEKDRAENVMIVDLLRNDLSKNCDDFSVKVTQLCGVESFATVHHLVSIVTGALRADRTPLDLLRGCFPGGSITGAPKVRAMEIIGELEPLPRGPYCGAMGYIGFDGTMDTNIVIRTLVYEGDTVRFNVGGGIVSDSDPAAEYQETLDKAAALFRSFEQTSQKAKAS